MKNILFMTVIILSIKFTSAADVYMGPKIGINFSTMRITNDATRAQTNAFNNDKRVFVGYNAGANFFIRFNNYIGLQPEVNFTMKGLKYVNNNSEAITRVMQIEWPVMLKAGYGKSNYFVYTSFGPYFTVNTAGTEIIRAPETTIKSNMDFDNFRRGDVGLGFGFGGMHYMKNGAIDVEFRYNMGLLKQVKPVFDPNVRWSSMGLNFAYIFKVKETTPVTQKNEF